MAVGAYRGRGVRLSRASGVQSQNIIKLCFTMKAMLMFHEDSGGVLLLLCCTVIRKISVRIFPFFTFYEFVLLE